MANAVNPYGDGRAAERTLDAMAHFFGLTDERPEEFMPEVLPEEPAELVAELEKKISG